MSDLVQRRIQTCFGSVYPLWAPKNCPFFPLFKKVIIFQPNNRKEK